MGADGSGRIGERRYHIDLRVSLAELNQIRRAAKKAGYRDTTPFVRDLLIFNLRPSASIWSWANWGLTLAESRELERAATYNGLTCLEWAKRVLLWWSQEPRFRWVSR